MSHNLLVLNSSATNGNPVKINLLETRKAATILRAINHKLRQELLRLIDRKGRVTVVEIYTTMRLDQPEASRHLALLRQAGFVNIERKGKYRFYSINAARLKEVAEIVSGL